ncbi:HlyD family secretion protein [Geovibrio thiophilus]|uniref:HlyD family secretion protein n=1 Tax=Geovibrio thiophilus TaxID=139438 RepID=A0A410JVW5_9BACT|nr:HlyD family secretion protein [Geovibrio thiophilus]QAR32199.1 HlyD family secretion protein [Geovibrio thiophilus]
MNDADKITEQREKNLNSRIKLRKAGFYGAVIIITAAAVFYGMPKFLYAMHHESTDNAYIKGTIIPVSAEVKGRIKAVHVSDNMRVKKGDVLFEIDQDDYLLVLSRVKQDYEAALAEEIKADSAVTQAEKNIRQAQAALGKAQTEASFTGREAERYGKLEKESLISKNAYDSMVSGAQEAFSTVKVAEASLEMAHAAYSTAEADRTVKKYKTASVAEMVKEAELNLEKTRVKAPADGYIGQNNAKTGRYVQPGQAVLAVVDGDDVWIEANYKETQMKRIIKGQEVEIKVDAFPGTVFKGHVDSFQPGTGAAFSLLPPENASGNFVKVVQRVPIKITLDEQPGLDRLVVGLSVVPSVNIK